jgi:MFS family permease
MLRVFSAFSAGRGADSAAADRRRNLLAVSLASFLASVGFMVAMPVLPGLMNQVSSPDSVGAGLGVGLWLGIAISVAPLLTALTGPIWASMGERFGHRAMIERSLICVGIGLGLMALAQSPLQLVASRALIGALGGTSVAALAAISSNTPRRDLGPAVGTLQAAQTAGAMFGPLIGGLIGGLIGMRESLIVAAVTFVLALGLVRWLYREVPAIVPEAPTRSGRAGDGDGQALGLGLAVVLIAAFTFQFVEGTFIVLLPFQLEHLGVASDWMTIVYGVGLSITYLAATIAAAVGGHLTKRWSAATLMPWVLALGLLVLVPMAFADQWWQFLGLRILLAAVAGAAPTLAYSAGAAVAAPERRARVVGLVSSAGILGWAASPLTAGALIQIDPLIQLGANAALYALLGALLLAWNRGLLDRLALPGGLSLQRLHAPRVPVLLPSVGDPRHLLERLPSATALLPTRRTRPSFTPTEVRAALIGSLEGARADAILEVAATPGRWLPNDTRRAFHELSRYGDRLPTILHLYRSGEDPETIGRRFSPLGGAWAVERTVDIASELIAKQLNR